MKFPFEREPLIATCPSILICDSSPYHPNRILISLLSTFAVYSAESAPILHSTEISDALFHLNSAANVALCPVMPVVPPGTAEKNTPMYASFPSVVYAGISETFSVISKESASLLNSLIGLFPKIIALGTGEFSFPDTDSDSFSAMI